MPNILTTYSIKVIANDGYGGNVSTMFNLTVKDSSITDTTLTETDLSTTLIIISSITGAIFIVCITSFACVLIIGGGAVLKRYRNKISKDESTTKAKEQKKEKDQQKSESTILSNDIQNIVEKELIIQREKPKIIEYDLDKNEQKEPMIPDQKEDIELEEIPNFTKDEVSEDEIVLGEPKRKLFWLEPNDFEYNLDSDGEKIPTVPEQMEDTELNM